MKQPETHELVVIRLLIAEESDSLPTRITRSARRGFFCGSVISLLLKKPRRGRSNSLTTDFERKYNTQIGIWAGSS